MSVDSWPAVDDDDDGECPGGDAGIFDSLRVK
jgi:hypothetical protein